MKVTSPRGSVAAMKFFFVGLIALAIIVLIAVRLYRGRITVEPKATSGHCQEGFRR